LEAWEWRSSAPEAGGTALIYTGSAVIRTVSPPDTSAEATIAVTIAVSDQATAGAIVNLTSGDATSSDPDPQATACIGDVADQIFANPPTAVSISDVLPGGGLLPAGSVIAVVGAGFQPEAQVQIEGVTLASTTFIDSSRIEVVTAADAQLDSRMVGVMNPDLTSATSYASLRATDLGESAIHLVAATEAIFPAQTRSSALFAAPGTEHSSRSRCRIPARTSRPFHSSCGTRRRARPWRPLRSRSPRVPRSPARSRSSFLALFWALRPQSW